jgi:glucan phosphoethanolaminetransferase (alkaline phosphatase superfamily)/DNA-directed RNA polymerase subunit RPC12/RpoP
MRNAKKTAAESNAQYYKIELILSIIMMCGAFTALIYLVVFVFATKTSDVPKSVIMAVCIITVGFGFVMFQDGMKRNILFRMFRKYTSNLTADPERSIVTLAKTIKADGKNVRNNIEYMIQRNWYPNAKIDLKNKRVIFTNEVIAPVKLRAESFDPAEPMVACKYCRGLNYDPKGDLAVCYYCGSKIKR